MPKNSKTKACDESTRCAVSICPKLPYRLCCPFLGCSTDCPLFSWNYPVIQGVEQWPHRSGEE
jgi:hypothetical protein